MERTLASSGVFFSFPRSAFFGIAGFCALGLVAFLGSGTPPAVAAGACPNEAVRLAQHATYLGECRALELVNNPDKGNQNALANGPEIHTESMTLDGAKALWSVTGGAPGGANGFLSSFLAERTPAGWTSRSVAPPGAEQLGGGGFKYRLEAATPDFSHFAFLAGSGSFEPNGSFTALRLDAAQNQEELQAYAEYPSFSNLFDLTSDGAHILAINPVTGQLEDIGKQGETEVVSAMPDGTDSECRLELEGQSFTGYTSNRGAAGINWRPGYHRMAATDASRVYFETSPNGECGNPYGLYVRNREADGGHGKTILIDPGTPTTESQGNVEVIRATPDGRSVYFVTHTSHASYIALPPAEQEVSFDPDDEDSNENADVYRWDEATNVARCLTCVVPDAHLSELSEEHTRGTAVSDDFSHIYFESESQLVGGEGEAGRPNIYVLSGGQIRFVANPGLEEENCQCALGYDGGNRSALSADGNVLLFKAAPDPLLTAEANLPPGALPEKCTNSVGNLRPCNQLYRYDDRDGNLECISCLSDGVTAFSVGGQSTLASRGGQFEMSRDGDTIAFLTSQPLLPGDVNGGTDIYEWRQGSLHLLTDGVTKFAIENSAPAVYSVDADGSNILLAADEPGRTGFEQDALVNLYDARIGGGFMPPSPAPHCSEESCQGPLQPAPGFEKAGTFTYSGPGNLGQARRRCARGRVRHHGRCVKRHKRKRAHSQGGRGR